MKLDKLTKWDIQDHLNTPEEIKGYLDAAFEDGDPKLIVAAIGDVARAKGISQIAEETGLTRAGLYKSLSKKGDPRLSTYISILRSLNLKMTVETVAD